MDGIAHSVHAAKLCRSSRDGGAHRDRYEYSQDFTLTEAEFAVRICEAVMDVANPRTRSQ